MTTKSLMEQFLEDTEEAPTNTELEEISKLAARQKFLQETLEEAEAEVVRVKEELRAIQEDLLPEAMLAIGISEFKLTDGSKITIKPEVYASIRKDFINQAVTWLDEQGLGYVVKDKVEINFDRGEGDKAKEIVKYAQKQGYNVSETLSVHPSTLKALVKEQLAKGVQFPEEYFSIQPVNKSILKNK